MWSSGSACWRGLEPRTTFAAEIPPGDEPNTRCGDLIRGAVGPCKKCGPAFGRAESVATSPSCLETVPASQSALALASRDMSHRPPSVCSTAWTHSCPIRSLSGHVWTPRPLGNGGCERGSTPPIELVDALELDLPAAFAIPSSFGILDEGVPSTVPAQSPDESSSVSSDSRDGGSGRRRKCRLGFVASGCSTSDPNRRGGRIGA